MLLVALAALSAIATRPQPTGDPAQWVRYSDIPRSEWSHATITSYDLTVDKTGQPIRCEITNPSGSPVIDKVVCASLMRRAHYKPALDESGAPSPSVVRDRVIWHPSGDGRGNQFTDNAPDIVVQIDSPALKKKHLLLKVIEIVDPSGNIESCTLEKGSPESDLVATACGIVGRPRISTIVRDQTGTAVRGVRAFNVGFLAGSETTITIR